MDMELLDDTAFLLSKKSCLRLEMISPIPNVSD